MLCLISFTVGLHLTGELLRIISFTLGLQLTGELLRIISLKLGLHLTGELCRFISLEGDTLALPLGLKELSFTADDGDDLVFWTADDSSGETTMPSPFILTIPKALMRRLMKSPPCE
jgi:hypothetical protein